VQIEQRRRSTGDVSVFQGFRHAVRVPGEAGGYVEDLLVGEAKRGEAGVSRDYDKSGLC